jgi:hypothetical protein
VVPVAQPAQIHVLNHREYVQGAATNTAPNIPLCTEKAFDGARNAMDAQTCFGMSSAKI